MTISVLMSVYRSETAANLQRALDSIWTKQTRKPDQIILIQDGQLPSDIVEIIKTWKKQLADIFISPEREENKGLTVSLNEGLNYVTCDLIARMDTDDISTPERFFLQHNYLESHPEIDILSGAVEIDDIYGSIKYIRHLPLTHEACVKVMHKYSPITHPGVMMRSTIFSEKGLKYDERYRNSQDIALWFDALKAECKFSNIEEVVLRFTESDDLYKRRGYSRARNEFLGYLRGIWKNFGLSWKLVYPIGRFMIRNLPPKITKKIYNSKTFHNIYKTER
jgi:glycosyltransferase involved in cell wall biosynthesis